MDEEKKKNSSKKLANTTKTSSRKSKAEKLELSNDELYELLKEKKKKKKTSKRTNSTKTSSAAKVTTNSNKKTTVKKTEKKSNVTSELSNDEIYEKLKAKKVSKKKNNSKVNTVKSDSIKESEAVDKCKNTEFKSGLLTNTAEVKYDIVNDIFNKKNEPVDKKDDIVDNSSVDNEKVIDAVVEDVIVVDKSKDSKKNVNNNSRMVVDRKDVSYDAVVKTSKIIEEEAKKKYADIEHFITLIDDKEFAQQLREALKDNKIEYIKPDYDDVDKIDEVEAEDIQEEFTNEIINVTLEKDIKHKKEVKRDKRSILIAVFSLVVIFLGFVSFLGVNYAMTISEERENKIREMKALEQEEKKEKERLRLIEEQKKKDYDACLIRPVSDADITDEIIVARDELTNYLASNYRTSVRYEDLTYGFTYEYNTSKVYYAASTIKMLDALYIYNKAALGELNLDDTITYQSKYKLGSSAGMSKHSYGEAITLRELVMHAVVVSDNTAHKMLVSYIGKSNLRNYGKSLGAVNVLSDGDDFGSISINDAMAYTKALNDFINNNEELGNELKGFFVQAEQNDIALPDLGIEAAHKYGQYSYFYHDIGIVYDSHPYVIAVLTNEGKKDFESIVKNINSHVYELHNLYYSNREKVCHLEVYGE